MKKIMMKLADANYNCRQVEENADRLIVSTAKTVAILKKSSPKSTNVVIVGQDADLLVLLCKLVTKDESSNIFFIKSELQQLKSLFFIR